MKPRDAIIAASLALAASSAGGQTRTVDPLNPATIIVARGNAVTLDAHIDPMEWKSATRDRMQDGSEVLLQHDGRFLYLGIRASRPGFPSACVIARDTVRILHASSALGTGIYTRVDSTWQLKTGFAFALRDRLFSDALRQRQDSFATANGWVGTTFTMSGTEKEVRVDLRLLRDQPRLAFGFFLSNDGPVVPWPAGVSDGCSDQRVVSGFLPPAVRFNNEQWALLEFR